MGARQKVREALTVVYERRLARALEGADIPRHVGVIMDGNRRWARAIGLEDVAHGHRRGADKIVDLLGWCDDAGVAGRHPLHALHRQPAPARARAQRRCCGSSRTSPSTCPGPAGAGRCARWARPRCCRRRPSPSSSRPRRTPADRPGATVNLAVGYGGRREIADAVRSLLAEHAERGTSLDELVEALEVEHIAEHLYTRGQPDPDLVIRTSGEQRLSGFLLWQTANAEFHFTDVYWPDFRRVDFLRALRDYSARHRRFGG